MVILKYVLLQLSRHVHYIHRMIPVHQLQYVACYVQYVLHNALLDVMYTYNYRQNKFEGTTYNIGASEAKPFLIWVVRNQKSWYVKTG